MESFDLDDRENQVSSLVRPNSTLARTALQKGISLPTVQKIQGHDNLQTTAIYFARK